MIQTYTFQRGEPIVYALRVKSGDPSGFTATAKLKPLGPLDNAPPDPAVAAVADFVATFVAATNGIAAHWLFTIPASVAATLPASRYITDEKMMFGGTPVKVTEPVIIVIKKSVSG